MALFNYSNKEITAKIVYYGPGLCGKTTNIQHLHKTINAKARGKLISLATETDRTLFFDFMPLELGNIRGFNVRFQLYTVPGQVHYNATRKLVLKGSDAVVFVADSQPKIRQENIESYRNLHENLQENGLDMDTIPLIIQLNKRDVEKPMEVEEMLSDLNNRKVPYYESVAINGAGVLETFKGAVKLLMADLSRRYGFSDLPPSKIAEERADLKASATVFPTSKLATEPILKKEAVFPPAIAISSESDLLGILQKITQDLKSLQNQQNQFKQSLETNFKALQVNQEELKENILKQLTELKNSLDEVTQTAEKPSKKRSLFSFGDKK